MSMKALQEQLAGELDRRQRSAARTKAQALEKALPPLPAEGDNSEAAHRAILDRCDRPDATAEDLAALRALVARSPGVAGDYIAPLRQALVGELDRIGRGLKRELTIAHLDARRKALGFDTAPALERGLIDHLLLCEVRLSRSENYVTAMDTIAGEGRGIPIDAMKLAEGRLSAAQRRYLAAVECLARVRRVRVELARVLPDGSAQAVAVERPGQ